jgi:hypothetical protein
VNKINAFQLKEKILCKITLGSKKYIFTFKSWNPITGLDRP